MDFLRRLFGGGQGSEPADEPAAAAEAEPAEQIEASDDAVEASATSTHHVPTASTEETPIEASSAVDVEWHKVANGSGESVYRGEVGGVHVATIAKLPAEAANGSGSWEWHLEVPTPGPAAGSAKRLKDAKPEVAAALKGWQP